MLTQDMAPNMATPTEMRAWMPTDTGGVVSEHTNRRPRLRWNEDEQRYVPWPQPAPTAPTDENRPLVTVEVTTAMFCRECREWVEAHRECAVCGYQIIGDSSLTAFSAD